MRKFAAGVLLFLFACSSRVDNPGAQDVTSTEEGGSVAADQRRLGGFESVLLDQLACKSPPQSGVVMSTLLRRQAIAYVGGADSTSHFVPVKPMHLLGFEIVALGGWQSGWHEGPDAPFERGIGVPGPDYLFVTLKGDEEEVRSRLASHGIFEFEMAPEVPDPRDLKRPLLAGYRRTSGVGIGSGYPVGFDGDETEVVTLGCSMTEMDMLKDIAARLNE